MIFLNNEDVKALETLLQPFSKKGFEASILHCQKLQRKEAFPLTYGEVEIASFTALLKAAGANEARAFLDLGAGIGRALCAAIWCYPHLKVTGIEIMRELVDIGRQAIKCVKQARRHRASNVKKIGRIELLTGDFFNPAFHHRISSHDMIWLSATCFSTELFQQIANHLSNWAAPRTKLLILSYALPDPISYKGNVDGQEKSIPREKLWRLLGRQNYQMSWSSPDSGVLVHLYEKCPPPFS